MGTIRITEGDRPGLYKVWLNDTEITQYVKEITVRLGPGPGLARVNATLIGFLDIPENLSVQANVRLVDPRRYERIVED